MHFIFSLGWWTVESLLLSIITIARRLQVTVTYGYLYSMHRKQHLTYKNSYLHNENHNHKFTGIWLYYMTYIAHAFTETTGQLNSNLTVKWYPLCNKDKLETLH
jgi:hypothetical protein